MRTGKETGKEVKFAEKPRDKKTVDGRLAQLGMSHVTTSASVLLGFPSSQRGMIEHRVLPSFREGFPGMTPPS